MPSGAGSVSLHLQNALFLGSHCDVWQRNDVAWGLEQRTNWPHHAVLDPKDTIHNHMIFRKDCIFAQGVIPCLLMCTSAMRGTNTIRRNERTFDNISRTVSDSMHHVNLTHSSCLCSLRQDTSPTSVIRHILTAAHDALHQNHM